MRFEKEPIPTPEITRVGNYPVIPEVINGIKVNFVGVEHTNEFFSKHHNTLEQLINKSSLVISEMASFDFAEDNQVFIDPKTVKPDSKIFFDKIADIASHGPKKISIVDPITSNTQNFEGLVEGSCLGGLVTAAVFLSKY